MDTGSALIARLFITSEVLNCWLYPRKHTNTTSQGFLTLERACVQPWWYRTLSKMLGGQESPDLAWLYHRVVPLRSYPALRPRRSNPSSHTGHVRDWASSTSTPLSFTLKDAAPALPPLFQPSCGSKCLLSSFSALLQHQIHPPATRTPRTLSLHPESHSAPTQPHSTPARADPVPIEALPQHHHA